MPELHTRILRTHRRICHFIVKHMVEMGSQRSNVEPRPLRSALTSLVGAKCLERRPGRDPLTGDRRTSFAGPIVEPAPLQGFGVVA
jgi:hypothetical protein